MKVRDIMSTSIITLSPEMGIIDATRILMENHINGAPVVNGKGRIVGILCRDDIITQQKKIPLPSFFLVLDAMIPLSSPRQIQKEMDKMTATTVDHAMTPKPVTVRPETDIEVVAGLMVDQKIHTIPVVDDKGNLVGVVGKEDVLRTILPR